MDVGLIFATVCLDFSDKFEDLRAVRVNILVVLETLFSFILFFFLELIRRKLEIGANVMYVANLA